MTQEVATTGSRSLDARSSPPKLSAALEWRIDRFVRGLDLVTATLTAAQREEARLAAIADQPYLRPASKDRIVRWVDELSFSLPPRNSLAEKPRRAWTAMLLKTSGDLPVSCWTSETRVAFARHRGQEGLGAFWPSDAEVDAFLRPMAREMRWRASALAEMAKPPPPPPEPPHEPTEEEKALVTNKVQQAIAAMGEGFRSQRPFQEPDLPRRASPITGEDLWERRNAARRSAGMPPLPRPETFEGYGT